MTDDQQNPNNPSLEEQIQQLQKQEQQKKDNNSNQGDDKKDPKDEEIERLKKELEEMKILAQRSVADYQNLRRRSEEEKLEFVKYSNTKLLTEILPFLDNIQRAINQLPENLSNNEWVNGIINIEKQFIDTLKKQGLTEIETNQQKLDPNFHEALMQTSGEKDMIIQEVEKGYMLNGKVIRFAKVIVGNGETTKEEN